MAKRARPRSGSTDSGSADSFPLRSDGGIAPDRAVAGGVPVVPSKQAVALFEQAMRRLQRHEYEAAASDFRTLISTFPAEGALRERSAVYLALCERELAKRPMEPQTLEERLTAATAALNNGDDGRAESLANAVLAEVAQHDLALYLLAAVAARRNLFDRALDLLANALSVNPEIRAQVRHDADFDDLKELDEFRSLVDPPSSAGDFKSPRRRRP